MYTYIVCASKYWVYTLMGLCAFFKVLDEDRPGGVCL